MAPSLVVRIAGNLEELRRNLKEGQGHIETTAAAMNKIAHNFQGEKLVQQAHALTAAIQKVGVSTLSTAEASRSLDTLNKAFDKMLRTGQDIPVAMTKTAADLRRMGRASEQADAAVNRITSTYRQFDGVLKMAGINLDAEVRALEDLNEMITRGIPSLGAWAGAAAVVATAIGSWKLGTKIGEVTGWTEAIAKGTAVLRGYGDVQQEEMLARMQSIELHGRAQEMWKLQAEGTKAATEAAQKHTDEMRRSGMVMATNATHMDILAKQLADVKKKREEDAKAAFAQSQAQSALGAQTETTTASIIKQTEAIDARLKKVAEEEAQRKAAVEKFMNAPTLNDRASASYSTDVAMLTRTQLDRIRAQFDPFGVGGDYGIWQRLSDLEAREGAFRPRNNDEFFQMQRDMAELAALRLWAQGRSRAHGGPVMGGQSYLVGERGPELFVPAQSGTIVPNGAGAAITVHVHAGAVVQHYPIGNDSMIDPLVTVIKNKLRDGMRQSGYFNEATT